MSVSDLKQQRRELTAKIRTEEKAEFERTRQADLATDYAKGYNLEQNEIAAPYH